MMKWIFFYLVMFFQCVGATDPKNVKDIGPHYEVFRFEKSENPQNILVVYSKLDLECRFVLESEGTSRPKFGFYWLMNGQDYKPVHSLIRRGIANRLQLVIPSNFNQKRDNFAVQVKDLIEIDPTLGDALVKVTAAPAPLSKGCDLKAKFSLVGHEVQLPAHEKLDASTMLLEKIYAESEKTIIPPFRKVVSLRFEGSNEKTGNPELRVYQAD